MPVQPIGYIKLWRELLTKPIWLESTPEQKTILITLLAMANFNGKQWEWQGKQFEAEPGQFVTSLERIAEACGKGITVKNVRTALKRFQNYGFLADRATKTGRLITIVNWGVYQSPDSEAGKPAGKDRADSGQSSGKDRAPKEESKEGSKVKKVKDYTPDFEAFWSAYPRKTEKQAAFKAWKSATRKTDTGELIKAAAGYARRCQLEATEQRYIKHATTFLNSQAYEDYLETEEKSYEVQQQGATGQATGNRPNRSRLAHLVK